MDKRKLHILRHSLGLPDGRFSDDVLHTLEDPDWPWRNHYATAPDCDGVSDVESLVALGYMRRGRAIEGGLIYYHVTDAGIQQALKEVN